MHKITDNFLNEREFNELRDNITPKTVNTLGTTDVFWVYADQQIPFDEPEHLKKVSKIDVVSKVHEWFLSHPMLSGSFHSSTLRYLIPLLAKIDPVALYRIITNLTVQQDKKARSKFHIDYTGGNLKRSEMNTSIYYLHTTNGGTILEDGTEVECRANRLVTYPYNTYHAGVLCTDQPYRIVINLNYFKDIDY
tara:strand:- start:657 stop:1235 length:579 start_codon:yes stop_codon:yes gene_type:complete